MGKSVEIWGTGGDEKGLPYMALWHDMHAGMYVWLVLGVSELGGGGGGGCSCRVRPTDWDKKEMGLWWWWWWEGKERELLMGKGDVGAGARRHGDSFL